MSHIFHLGETVSQLCETVSHLFQLGETCVSPFSIPGSNTVFVIVYNTYINCLLMAGFVLSCSSAWKSFHVFDRDMLTSTTKCQGHWQHAREWFYWLMPIRWLLIYCQLYVIVYLFSRVAGVDLIIWLLWTTRHIQNSWRIPKQPSYFENATWFKHNYLIIKQTLFW